jgi:hypothetical protein
MTASMDSVSRCVKVSIVVANSIPPTLRRTIDEEQVSIGRTSEASSDIVGRGGGGGAGGFSAEEDCTDGTASPMAARSFLSTESSHIACALADIQKRLQESRQETPTQDMFAMRSSCLIR